ncbi:MAG: hypothetical protein H6587_02365 [Flavobacteriales bacterium]|nr:hypothetical protein [Flavobacteriales bacterium]MCB9363390.1 hypothetical protein [Flavobacteriales bacterium]
MNDKLRKAEKKMFISIYGDKEFNKLKSAPKVKLPKEYSDTPPKRLRFEIDERNNTK